MQSQISTALQQKQAYLRDNIQPEKYQDFYQYCQKVIGTVDINSWTISQIQEIINKFNMYIAQQTNTNKPQQGRLSYSQYQSVSNYEVGYVKDSSQSKIPKDQVIQFSQSQSSKVQKPSAVDLLDQILQEQSYTSTKTQPKQPQTQFKTKTHTYTQKNNNINLNQQLFATNSNVPNTSNKNSPIDFNQFDLWTSNITTKNDNQLRNKSSSLVNKSNSLPIGFGGSPQSTKNVSNVQNYYNLQQHQNTNTSSMMLNITQQKNTKNSNQRFDQDFSIFTAGIEQQLSKKSSPYAKKQSSSAYHSQKPSIRLKQVKQINQLTQNRQNIQPSLLITQNQQQFQQTINCIESLIRNGLTDRNLNISIEKYQIVQRKFLASDYAMYNIKIMPLGIQCKRNYQDFSKLRENLKKFFPGITLPYLDEVSWLSSTNTDFIDNQKKMLQFFIRDLIRNKQIRNSRIMQDFLTITDHKTIKRKFQSYDKMQTLKSFSQMCLLNAKVHITLNNQQKIFIQNFQKFLYHMGDLYSRQQKLIQYLISQYNQLLKIYKSLITLMQQIQKQIKQFNNKVNVNHIKYLNQSIKILKQTYTQQFKNIKFDYQINHKKILPFIKYERKNFLQLSTLTDLQKKMKKSYDKRSLIQKIGVGQTYISQNAKFTKKSLLQQNSSLIVLKYQVGYLGYQVRHQGQRIFDQLAVKTLLKWKSLGQSFVNKFTTSIDYWQKLMKNDKDKFNTELTS